MEVLFTVRIDIIVFSSESFVCIKLARISSSSCSIDLNTYIICFYCEKFLQHFLLVFRKKKLDKLSTADENA